MTQFIQIHATHPQLRLVNQVVAVIRKGGVIAYPTDSAYALGCCLGDSQASERIKALRRLDKAHHFTLICQNLSELSTYAYVNNSVFRLLKAYTPGPYTFILPASREVPRRLQHAKRKTIGLRIPDNLIVQQIVKVLAEPLMSVTLILPGDDLPLTDAREIYQRLAGKVDLVVDGGPCSMDMTTVVDLVSGTPQLIRIGKGDPSPFA